MDADKTFFERDAFSRHCGIRLLDTQPGTATAQLTIGPQHLNSMGIVHGAAIFALADAVFAAAANSHGYVAVAVNINISYIKAATDGVLTATAQENNPQGRMGSYTIAIRDREEDLVAAFEGLAYRKFDKQ
ncbi:MAG: PaaI family thioesterase [Planctomycetales bacterium]|nr:PaaI family thioesterase [Planctomycetales bacterium]